MIKTFYITESQYKNLLEKKREEKKIYEAITADLNLVRNTLSEGVQLNEGIVDTIKDYVRKGAMTTALVASLLAANQVNAQQLAQAGVPKATIEQGIQKAKFDPSKMSNKEIENRLIQIMRKNNLKGSLDDYNKLNSQQKENVLNGIKNQIKSLDDINQISIGNWEKYQKSGDNIVKFDTQTEQRIKVVTVDTVSTIPLSQNFKFNSFQLENSDELNQQLEELTKGYTEIDSIVIESSSSTLRNRGEAEGMTWKELSQKRAEEIAKLLIGDKVDLGGEGKNIIGEITTDKIQINSDGTNGDGTSGPKSPYEVNPEYVKSYTERGIDPKLWKSASKENALPETELSSYSKYQYVNVKIYGRVVETETEEVPSFRYVVLTTKKLGGEIKKGTNKESTDVNKCPVMVKKINKVKIPQGSVLQGMK